MQFKYSQIGWIAHTVVYFVVVWYLKHGDELENYGIEMLSELLAICEGNQPATCVFP